MAETDKLSWLLLGRGPDGLAVPTPPCCSALRWPCWPAKAKAHQAS